ncbi:MAG TPA: hypothetical protein VG434_07760 [Sphingomicrobium sp.]|nr:hypothetical protein [Sphingomicrobium sp.]
MNPDVFITIAFAGIAVLVPLVALLFVVPQVRREEARVAHSEAGRVRRMGAAGRHVPARTKALR